MLGEVADCETIAPFWGTGGREFESRRSDQIFPNRPGIRAASDIRAAPDKRKSPGATASGAELSRVLACSRGASFPAQFDAIIVDIACFQGVTRHLLAFASAV